MSVSDQTVDQVVQRGSEDSIFQHIQNTVGCSPKQHALARAGIELDDPQKFLPTSSIL